MKLNIYARINCARRLAVSRIKSIQQISKSNIRKSKRRLVAKVNRFKRIFISKSKTFNRRFSRWNRIQIRNFKSSADRAVLNFRIYFSRILSKRIVHRFCLSLRDIDILVVANKFPHSKVDHYGGEFIRSRVSAYRKKGYKVAVIELISNPAKKPVYDKNEYCLRLYHLYWNYLDSDFISKCSAIFIHSPRPCFTNIILDLSRIMSVSVFYHGYEVRDYRRLYYNYSTQEMALAYFSLKETHKNRIESGKTLIEAESVNTVFVSIFLFNIAKKDIRFEKAVNTKIIPNFIDPEFYTAKFKTSEMRRNILLIRPFSKRNYAGDIALKAILKMAGDRPKDYAKLSVSIYGFGRYFFDEVSRIEHLNNVSIVNRMLLPKEMKQVFDSHGVFMSPTRFDTQGVTMCEAMACGLVPVVNKLGGIPEFSDDDCAVLVKPESVNDFAKGIWYLIDNGPAFERMSKNATKKIRNVCGTENTIDRELRLW